jgi:hypothetical protein
MRIKLKEMEDNITYDEKHQVIYKGVNLGITREMILDYQFQTGYDPVEMVENLYKNSLPVIRDKKINQILDEEN